MFVKRATNSNLDGVGRKRNAGDYTLVRRFKSISDRESRSDRHWQSILAALRSSPGTIPVGSPSHNL
jgi:hypothetical protein